MRTIVIKLGGSMVVPNNIDINFLKEFKSLICAFVNKGIKFGIVVGGGKICRNYQDSAKEFIGNDQKALDWLGIEATKLNAKLIQTIFGDLADKNIITDYSKEIKSDKPILIGAGYKPDWSTDFDTVIMAEKFGEKEVIELSNIDFVYDKDPNIFKEAKKFENMTWDQMLKICDVKWEPGLNIPLDPSAAKLGAEMNHKIVFLKGLENLKNYINGNDFNGTVIN